MPKLSIRLLASLLFSVTIIHAQQSKDDLDRYVERLRLSKVSGGNETGFLTPGSDFLYGQDYFEAKNYSSATGYFMQVIDKDKDNAFAYYQLAISLIRQNDKYKTQQAQEYLQKAFQLNSSLKARYAVDVPAVPPTPAATPAGGLDGYLEKLRYSRSTRGKETEMNSPGRDVMNGYDYYERGEYGSAAIYFRQALEKDPGNPYIPYLLAVSHAGMGEKAKAAEYYNQAVGSDAGLKSRYANDVADATAKNKKYEDSRKIPTTPAAKPVYGGPLVFGKYTCHQTVYNGANASQPFSHPYKGYFELKKDGTYRWVDNGVTGRYTYDAKTGTIKFLSGQLASAQPSLYQGGKAIPQITVNFTADYRWECGCEK